MEVQCRKLGAFVTELGKTWQCEGLGGQECLFFVHRTSEAEQWQIRVSQGQIVISPITEDDNDEDWEEVARQIEKRVLKKSKALSGLTNCI